MEQLLADPKLYANTPELEEIVNQVKTNGKATTTTPFAGPNGSPQTKDGMFNPSLEYVYQPDGTVRAICLVRGTGKDKTIDLLGRKQGISRQIVGELDGLNFREFSPHHPMGTPSDNIDIERMIANSSTLDIEDVRTTFIDGIFYLTYTETFLYLNNNFNGGKLDVGFRPAIASTTDFRYFHRINTTGLPNFSKDLVLHPRKYNGLYVCDFKPTLPEHLKSHPDLKKYASKKEGIWVAYSPDLKNWYNPEKSLDPDLNEEKIGPGTPMIDTPEGPICLPHAVRPITLENGDKGRNYSMKLTLRDRNNPSRVLAITDYIFQPEREFELHNPDIPNLQHFFITGAKRCILQNGVAIPGIRFVYGAADRHSGQGFISDEYIGDILHSKSTIRLN